MAILPSSPLRLRNPRLIEDLRLFVFAWAAGFIFFLLLLG